MINGTTADCKIKSITVTDSTAAISCILYSLSPAREHKAFKFYLRDKDLTKPLIPVSENIYWIDRINNYNNDVTNIDVNQYKEILLTVDITNANQGDLIGNKWVRNCNLVLRNIKDPSNNFAWVSEDLTLVSKEFEIPKIRNLNIYSDKDFNLYIDFIYKYTSQSDFKYNNSNLYTTIKILSPYTGNTLETVDILEEDNSTSKVAVTFLNTYNATVKIQIQLKNSRGEVLSTLERLYTPIVRKSSTYIKTSNGIERILAYYVKDNTIHNNAVVATPQTPTPRLRMFKAARPIQETPKTNTETPTLKVNFNNAVIKLTALEPPKINYVGGNSIKFTNPNVGTFTNCRMTISLGDIVLADTTGNSYIHTFEPNELLDSYTFKIELIGSISLYETTEKFERTFKVKVVCSNNIVCSNTLLCVNTI